MSLEELLSALAARDIRLRVEAQSLRFNAPPGALTPELRAEIGSHKAALLELLQSPDVPGLQAPLVARRGAVAVPLTPAQERLWFVDQIYPGDPGFNITRNVWLRGPVDAERLERSLAMIVERHEVLRTVVDRSGEEPVAVSLPAASWRLRRMNLLGASDAEFAKLIRKEADHHFDLTRGPLFRATLAQKQPDEHLLLLNFHHLVFDGSSTALFFRELSEIYRALEAGREPKLPELKIQFGDFAVWQRERLKTSALDRDIAYWRQQLSGHRELAILPTDRPRSGWNTHRVGQVLAHLPKERVEQLEAFARAEGITLYMLLLAAYETVLHRFTGMGEVRVGSPVSARTRVETESLLGFLLNVLVMRAEFSPDLTVRGLLQAVKQTALDGFAHREVPMEQLAAELRESGDARGSGFFQAFFNLLNFEEAELSLPGVVVQHVPLRLIDAAFELSLFMQPGPDGLRAAWNYQVDLFVPETVERLSAAFLAVLEAMVARPEARVAELPLLGSLEQFRLLSLGKGPAQDVPPDLCLHELIEMQAARTPEAIAVRLEETTLAYAALDARANQLAHFLRQRGVGPDTFVAVLGAKSPDLIVAVLAVLKAGGAYVPIDPAMPAERIQLILEDARPVVVLTELAFAAALASAPVPIVRLDADRALFAAQPVWNPPPAATASNLAYAIYTSGSSGRPKGVLIEHRAVVNHTLSAIAAYGLGTEDRVLQFASLSFDASAEEIFPALASGAELVLRPETMIETPATFLARSREWGLTVLDLPTAYWHELVWAMETEALSWPPSVRVVIIGGEKARLDRLVSWRQLAGATPRLFNTYGPTEATIVATRWEAPADEHVLAKLTELPIGTAISNTFTAVLDAGLNPVPVDVPGELHIGGAGLARGYLNRPELTAQKFIAHPALGGARLYKTGDLVRLRADGQLEFCGRVDQQVKIRGFRIELGDIEAALAAHPGIAGCAVTDFVDAQGERRLAAYFVAAAAPPAARELRSFLLKSLPDYMVPAVFVALPALPLNTSGKVDRRALPPPAVSEAVGDAESFVPPEPGLETTVANVWAEILHRPRVGAEDNFFELGGHSLLATRAVARLRHALNCELPLRWMFETPTVRALARRLEPVAVSGERHSTPSAAAEDWPAREPGAPLPLSGAQESLRFLHQLDPANAAYNIVTCVKFDGPLQVATLRRALTELIARHEVLRTTIGEREGRGEMRIHPPREAELKLVDLRASADREARAQEMVQAEGAKPFDLAAGPLFRTQLLQLETERHWLVLNVHHILFDGWSMELLLDELAQLYHAFAQNQASPLAPLRRQFADYVAWQRARADQDREQRARELAFWRQQLAGAPEQLELPTDYPRATAGDAAGQIEFDVPATVTQPLRALASAERGTLFMVLLGAYQLLLARSAGQEEVCVGSPVAGRNHVATEKLLGYFVSMLILRGSVAGNPTFRELLVQVRERTLGAFSHQDVPLDQIVAELNPHRSAGGSPLFQAAFVLNNETMAKSRIPGLTIDAEPIHNASAKFDVALIVREHDGGLRCVLQYRSGLFSTESMQEMAGRFQRLLEQAAVRPDQRVGNFALLTPAERERVLVEWNHTTTPFPREATVPGLFEQEVARRPDAVALVLGDESVTYAELNQRSNRLAHWLRQRDVAPGVNVAVCLERSIEMVVALLAILKSGGAYVPLDVSQPPERHKFIVDDAQPALVLTDRRLARGLQGVSAPVVCLDEFSRSLITLPAENPVTAVQATTRAYVLYTSGSTGRPKGVLVPHRGIVRLVRDTNYATFGPDEVFLQLAPVAFDASTFEIWGSLLNGGRLVIMPSGLNSVDDIAAVIQRHRVTTLWLTAGLFHHVVETRVEALRGLRQLLAGGDVLAPAAVQKVLREVPGCRMINGYGPTENTTFTCCHTITAADAGQGSVPIGRPISNTRVYVLDAQLQLVPVGVPGELFIAGDGLATGYLNRPELTAAKFIADPFAAAPGEKMYRSGDRVRWRADGTIEFLGRLDNQVKIRGFRVEPGEVEMALSEMPGVQQAAVVVQEARPGEKRLVGFYVARPEMPLSVAAVKQYLAARLPAYLVPAVLAPLDALPLTLNGKVDRSALAARRVTLASDASYVAPRTPTEERVAAIWAGILNVERVGVEDTFFDLGGHSLAALRVISRINTDFHTDLPLRRLFEQPTVAGLAAQLDALRADSAAADAASRRFVSLSPLRVTGSRPTLFLLSGGDGDDAELLLTARIVQDMHPDQPVYGFVARGFDGQRAPHRTVREMARDYILELKRVQPKGPYFLGGICLGCLVAAEMAAQLLEAGDTVAPVSFVVPRHPPTSWEVFLELNPVGKVFRHLSRLREVPSSEKLRYLWFRVRNAPKRLVNPLPTIGKSDFNFRTAHMHALLSHRVRPMNLRGIFLMDAAQHRGRWAQQWSPILRGGIQPILIAGDHHSSLREYSMETARHLQQAVDQAAHVLEHPEARA